MYMKPMKKNNYLNLNKIWLTGLVLVMLSLPSQAKTILAGKITHAEGDLIEQAGVAVLFPSDHSKQLFVRVDKSGYYRIELDENGLYYLII